VQSITARATWVFIAQQSTMPRLSRGVDNIDVLHAGGSTKARCGSTQSGPQVTAHESQIEEENIGDAGAAVTALRLDGRPAGQSTVSSW